MNYRYYLTSLWGLLTCLALYAQEPADTAVSSTKWLDEVDVTQTRHQREAKSTAPLHILDKSDLLTMGISDIGNALQRMPGVTLRDYGGAGGMKTVSVRGFGARHTGVSYDGIMLNDCQSGEIDVSRYSLENVENLSLVVGDNDDIFISARQASVPAILHITTLERGFDLRRAASDAGAHLSAQIKAGSFGYVSPFVRYEQNLTPNFGLSAVGEYVYAENDYPFTLRNVTLTTKEHRTNSRMKQGHGEVNFIWLLEGAGSLTGKAYYYDNDRRLPGQVRYYTNLSNESLHDRNAFGQLKWLKRWKSDWALSLQGKYNWAESKYDDGMISSQIQDADYWQREYYTSANLLFTPFHQWSFDYSADYSYNNLRSSLKTDTRPYRHTLLQTATAKYSDRGLTVLARLLYSVYLNGSETGTASRDMKRLSPSLSLSYRLLQGKGLYVRASYKNIFRAPTFNESYFFHYGSPLLEPESTDQLNVGVTYATHDRHKAFDLLFTLDAFVNHIRDKIVAVPFNMFVWTCVNVGKARMMGLDATARTEYRLGKQSKLVATANYSFQQVENRTMKESPYYGNQLAYCPVHSGGCSLGWENPWVSFTLNGEGMSDRWTTNEHFDGTHVSGYFEIGFTAWRNFQLRLGKGKRAHQLGCRIDVRNLLDHQYEIVKLYPMPGINWNFSVNYNL